MNFYQSIVGVRKPFFDRYAVHQQVDYLCQEIARNRLPYSFYVQASHKGSFYSDVMVRSLCPLNMPGETRFDCSFSPGQRIVLSLELMVENRVVVDGKQTVVPATEKSAQDLTTSLFSKNGFKVHNIHQEGEMSLFKIDKPGKSNKLFYLPAINYLVDVEVEEVGLAERAWINGIGRKRIFGFGMLRELAL